MEVVSSIETPKSELAHTRILGVTGPRGRERNQMLMIVNAGRLVLPVEFGQEFAVVLTNLSDSMVAFPAYLGRDGERKANTYAGQQEMDPNDLPANGGMSEVSEYSNRRANTTAIDGIKLPGNLWQSFVAVEGGEFGDMDANELLIYRRTLPGATYDQVVGGSVGTRGQTTAPVIGTAEVTKDGRQLTGLDYLRDATEISRVTIVGPDQAADMLVEAGLEVPTNWEYGSY